MKKNRKRELKCQRFKHQVCNFCHNFKLDYFLRKNRYNQLWKWTSQFKCCKDKKLLMVYFVKPSVMKCHLQLLVLNGIEMHFSVKILKKEKQEAFLKVTFHQV